jgi:hypothetical protein
VTGSLIFSHKILEIRCSIPRSTNGRIIVRAPSILSSVFPPFFPGSTTLWAHYHYQYYYYHYHYHYHYYYYYYYYYHYHHYYYYYYYYHYYYYYYYYYRKSTQHIPRVK